jgi:hypothetical protein
MDKLSYLKEVIKQGLFTRLSVLLSLFAVTKPKSADPMEHDSHPFKLILQPWGYDFITPIATLEKITDSVPNQPLFQFKERIVADSTWCPTLKEPTETSIGTLLFNLICLVPAFGTKFPYQNGKLTISDIEAKIALKLQNTPAPNAQRSDEFYYVDEYLKFIDSLQYLARLSQVCTWSATKKTLLAPPGIKQFKETLINGKYKGKLKDPVELTNFETELKAFDKEYLKDDPAFGTYVKGKILDTSRKKLFLNVGADNSFKNTVEVVPVLNSLEEGWPTEPEQFVAVLNGLRYSSFSRGAETVKGGVSAKQLLRAANNFKIVPSDCGTKLGILRSIDKTNYEKSVGRYVMESNAIKLIETKEDAAKYIGKTVRFRSPMYCKVSGDSICRYCAGERLAKYPTGLTIPLTEVSAIILSASMKQMHVSGVSTAKMDITEVLS